MLDLIIPILFVAILFISKQVVNKVLPTHTESLPFPEGENFPEIETDVFWDDDTEKEPKRVKSSSRTVSEEGQLRKSNKVVVPQLSSERCTSYVGRTSSMSAKGASSGKRRNDLAETLRTSNGARRAFIYSELLNRKYE